jgi:hypothetical protein
MVGLRVTLMTTNADIMGYSHGTSMIQTPISWRLMGLYVWEYY